MATKRRKRHRSRARAGLSLRGRMYFVLAVLYESWLQPMLILSALPLASVGGFLGLLVFHQTLSVPSFIGLIGGVVNHRGVVHDRNVAYLALQPKSRVHYFSLDSFSFACMRHRKLVPCTIGLLVKQKDDTTEGTLEK